VRVGPRQVEIELVGEHFGEEVAAARKVFEVEELVFFDPMHGFHIALVRMRGRRDTHMLAVAESFGKITPELFAVVGLPDQVSQRDAVAIQMLLDAGSKNGARRSAAIPGESPEQQTAADAKRARVG